MNNINQEIEDLEATLVSLKAKAKAQEPTLTPVSFKSKRELAKALMEGRTFKTPSGATLMYTDSCSYTFPFRLMIDTLDSGPISGQWLQYADLQEINAVPAVKLQQQIAELEKPKQWEPRGGYHAVLSSGFNIPLAVITAEQRKFGVVRQTKEAAEKASAAMRTHNRLLAYVDEFGGDWEADWDNFCQDKYSLTHKNTCVGSLWSKAVTGAVKGMGTVYMSQDCAQGLVAKLNSGEVVL